jgi:hypothetical protein
MLREITGWGVVVLLVAAIGGFAWLSRHPDAPWLERAESWPAVGRWPSASGAPTSGRYRGRRRLPSGSGPRRG